MLLFSLTTLLLLLVVVAVVTGSIELWRYLTTLGDEEFYLVFAVLAFYLAPDPLQGFSVVLAVVLSGELNVVLKYSINAPRPENPLVEVEGPGFPSGHAQVSSSFWSAVALTWRKWSTCALSVLVVVSVSLSRLYLRAHFVSDVLGGVLLGVLVTALTRLFLLRILRFPESLRLCSLGALSLVLGALAFYMGAELGAVSALAGLSGVFVVAPVTYKLLKPLSSTRTSLRLLGFTASTAVLVSAHYVSSAEPAVVRTVLFFACSVVSLLLIPVLVSRISSRG